MEKNGFDGNDISKQSKKVLQSETWQEVREKMKTEEKIDNADEIEEKNADLEREDADKETGETQEEKSGDDVPANNVVSADPIVIKQMAKEKLEREIKADKDKNFTEPVIGYLLKRCEDDLGLAKDVMQEHKTWSKCFDYIFEQARKQAKGNRAAVRDDVVYEWAEDYYHKDDKVEEEKKAKEDAERKERQKKETKKRKAKAKENIAKTIPIPQKKEEVPKEPPKSKKRSKDMEGQLDMFSMMGM